VGKSAIAQSLSEKFQEKEQLLASFFFSRGDSSRNNGTHLIPTLVSHLVHNFEPVIPFIEDRIIKHWDICTKSFQTQIRELLIKPLCAVKSNGRVTTHPPRLIVIDGLDECQNPDVQCELLRVISCAIPQIPYPVRVFFTSRPVAHITNVFDHDRDLQAIKVQRYNLSDDPDEEMDIRKYVEKEFEDIRRVDPSRYLPHTWPDQGAINSLVERSSGNFTYASTVIKYIRSQKHCPVDLQEVIHRFPSRNPPSAQPNASKDQQDSHVDDCTDNLKLVAVGSSVSEYDSSHENKSLNHHFQSSDTEVGPRTHKDRQRDPCKKEVESPRQKAFLAACRNGHAGIIQLLLSRNDVCINSRGEDGQTALFAASCGGHEAVVKLLLSQDDVAINVIATDSDLFGTYPSQTALLAASRRGHDGIVKLLLSRNDVDINLRDTDGRTALFEACRGGREAVVKVLLSRNDVDINIQDMDGRTALFEACRGGREAVVKVLLSRNDVAINTTATDSDLFGTYPNQTALLAASRRGHAGIVKLLVSRSDLDASHDGQQALFLASFHGHEGIVKQLLTRNDVDINIQDMDGRTALFEACRGGREAVVKVLLSRNDVAINTTATDSDLFGTYPSQTPLSAASRRGYDRIVKLLLSRNDVDINSQDEDGQTALLLASCHGHEATVELLLSRNAI
jgi:ankyrin repeat protein